MLKIVSATMLCDFRKLIAVNLPINTVVINYKVSATVMHDSYLYLEKMKYCLTAVCICCNSVTLCL